MAGTKRDMQETIDSLAHENLVLESKLTVARYALKAWSDWDDNGHVAFLNSARKKTKKVLADVGEKP